MPSIDSSTEIWLFVLGAACAIIGFMAVWILNSINKQIEGINKSMQDLNKDLRDGVTGLDRRVTVIEQQVNVCEWHRRSSNGHSE